MAMGTALLGLLAFLLGSSGTSAEPQNSERSAMRECVLTGNWTNELNSTMQITDVDELGMFRGVYLTAVSSSSNPIRHSPLQGFQHLERQGRHPVFGFTVNWTFSESITVFVGQYFQDGEGKEQLKTTWLLRVAVPSMKEDWGATKVGTDTFHRTK